MDTKPLEEGPMTGQAAVIEQLAREHAERPGALLPILHAVQARFGYVPPEAVAVVAGVLNLSRAEVHGVVSFYHFFRSEAPGKHTLSICCAEACQSMGSRALARHASDVLKIEFHQTTADGKYSLEPIYCLGNCAASPAVMIDETVHGRVTPDRLDALLADGEEPQ